MPLIPSFYISEYEGDLRGREVIYNSLRNIWESYWSTLRFVWHKGVKWLKVLYGASKCTWSITIFTLHALYGLSKANSKYFKWSDIKLPLFQHLHKRWSLATSDSFLESICFVIINQYFDNKMKRFLFGF